MLTRRKVLGVFAIMPFVARPAFASAPDFFTDDGLAIRGTDPVAYFTDHTAVAGNEAHQLLWRGAVWRFASSENRVRFEMNPTHYAPRYGGYCAYAMAQGALATTDPQAFTLFEDRLYLNYSRAVRDIWSTDKPGNILRADGHWPTALG